MTGIRIIRPNVIKINYWMDKITEDSRVYSFQVLYPNRSGFVVRYTDDDYPDLPIKTSHFDESGKTLKCISEDLNLRDILFKRFSETR